MTTTRRGIVVAQHTAGVLLLLCECWVCVRVMIWTLGVVSWSCWAVEWEDMKTPRWPLVAGLSGSTGGREAWSHTLPRRTQIPLTGSSRTGPQRHLTQWQLAKSLKLIAPPKGPFEEVQRSSVLSVWKPQLQWRPPTSAEPQPTVQTCLTPDVCNDPWSNKVHSALKSPRPPTPPTPKDQCLEKSRPGLFTPTVTPGGALKTLRTSGGSHIHRRVCPARPRPWCRYRTQQ